MTYTVTKIEFQDGSNDCQYCGFNAYTAILTINDEFKVTLTGDENGCFWEGANIEVVKELENMGIVNDYYWLKANAK